ncbi:MAG: polysaccharide deacetylase family protein [Oceanospirillaceae bacterium]|nr:polysaccharide deacetylase family protein [Oceanospirillaceae bacterium]MCP5334629.1 polysaccharide deacetylase family protein [Oceanospirillaceae bacterium]MCP5351343.1 polysaccharide deacetylase family protein [Oceanospirillaceae bacterium]
MDNMLDAQAARLRFGFTFDDGYANVGEILNLPRSAPMTVYLATGFIDIKRRFWATSIESLLLDARVTALNLSDLGLGEFVLSDKVSRRHAITNLNCLLKRMPPNKIDEIMQSIYERLDIESDDSNQFLSWAQVKALRASGVTIGSHTHNHAITSMVSEAEFIDEIALSNQTIISQLGEKPLHFAYPNGQKQDIAPFCEKVLVDAGYRSAVTTIEGDNRIGDNPFMLRRYNLSTERMQTPWGTPSRAMFTTLLSNPLRMH